MEALKAYGLQPDTGWSPHRRAKGLAYRGYALTSSGTPPLAVVMWMEAFLLSVYLMCFLAVKFTELVKESLIDELCIMFIDDQLFEDSITSMKNESFINSNLCDHFDNGSIHLPHDKTQQAILNRIDVPLVQSAPKDVPMSPRVLPQIDVASQTEFSTMREVSPKSDVSGSKEQKEPISETPTGNRSHNRAKSLDSSKEELQHEPHNEVRLTMFVGSINTCSIDGAITAMALGSKNTINVGANVPEPEQEKGEVDEVDLENVRNSSSSAEEIISDDDIYSFSESHGSGFSTYSLAQDLPSGTPYRKTSVAEQSIPEVDEVDHENVHTISSSAEEIISDDNLYSSSEIPIFGYSTDSIDQESHWPIKEPGSDPHIHRKIGEQRKNKPVHFSRSCGSLSSSGSRRVYTGSENNLCSSCGHVNYTSFDAIIDEDDFNDVQSYAQILKNGFMPVEEQSVWKKLRTSIRERISLKINKREKALLNEDTESEIEINTKATMNESKLSNLKKIKNAVKKFIGIRHKASKERKYKLV